jgi:hypothetical protein
LQASSKGARIAYSGATSARCGTGRSRRAKELVAGFWIWQVKNKAEAVEWAKRIPFQEGEVEIRQVFEEEDFGKELTPELREQERRQRAAIEKNKQRSGK